MRTKVDVQTAQYVRGTMCLGTVVNVINYYDPIQCKKLAFYKVLMCTIIGRSD